MAPPLVVPALAPAVPAFASFAPPFMLATPAALLPPAELPALLAPALSCPPMLDELLPAAPPLPAFEYESVPEQAAKHASEISTPKRSELRNMSEAVPHLQRGQSSATDAQRELSHRCLQR